jgi:4-hydroxybenzoate polyprenyltransferase
VAAAGTRAPSPRSPLALLSATHPGPALAVTAVAGLLAAADGAAPDRVALVAAAVLAGQLSIGWSNDLLDLARDRQVGRLDKPLAAGTVDARTVRVACVVALVLVVPLSLACGVLAGVVHLACVGCGWAYNLGLKATVWSWLPYALAFGGLPVFVSLAAGADPAWWAAAAGALLGVGAHLVNTLPDLDDDRATGVLGLPHRIGAGPTRVLAVAVLLAASVLLATVAPGLATAGRVVVLVAAVLLSLVALRSEGRRPFQAVVLLAVVDVVTLVVAR